MVLSESTVVDKKLNTCRIDFVYPTFERLSLLTLQRLQSSRVPLKLTCHAIVEDFYDGMWLGVDSVCLAVKPHAEADSTVRIAKSVTTRVISFLTSGSFIVQCACHYKPWVFRRTCVSIDCCLEHVRTP